MWDLIVSVPEHFLSFYFRHYAKQIKDVFSKIKGLF